MSIFKTIEFPYREFNSKGDMIEALVVNKSKIITIKKSQIYKSNEKGSGVRAITKGFTESLKASINAKSGFIYPIISTTKFMDSHLDCHFNGCFTKTVKEQQGNIVYALDHQLKYNDILAWEEHLKMSIHSLDWGIVGKNYEGQTEGLVFEISKDNIRNPEVLKDIETRADKFQNSIRMVYHKIVLGVDSDSKEFREENEYFKSKIDSIVNKELAISEGHFWGIEELGINKEGSLVVAGGSNSATSIFHKDIEPLEDTQKTEPPTGTQSTFKSLIINI